jgi:hypothetical protein
MTAVAHNRNFRNFFGERAGVRRIPWAFGRSAEGKLFTWRFARVAGRHMSRRKHSSDTKISVLRTPWNELSLTFNGLIFCAYFLGNSMKPRTSLELQLAGRGLPTKLSTEIVDRPVKVPRRLDPAGNHGIRRTQDLGRKSRNG